MSDWITVTFLGVLIGILVSAPMGPTGVVCMRRTLSLGCRAGIYTGIGAIASDIIYAVLAYLGDGFLVDLFERETVLFRILGSVLLLIFGFFFYFYPPSFNKKESFQSQKYSAIKLISSAFVYTVSNPGVVVLFGLLFLRFNFVREGPQPYFMIWSLLSIVMGAMLWWSVLTYVVSHYREKSSISGIRLFNKIIALVFISLGFLGLIIYLIQIIL